MIVGIIDSVLAGIIAGVACQALGWPVAVQLVVGLLIALTAAVLLGAAAYRRLGRLRRDYCPRFPEQALLGKRQREAGS